MALFKHIPHASKSLRVLALQELAGEKASAVEIAPEEPIDAVWEEPVVFDGCSSKGQARPDQAQPIHIVPKAARQAHSSQGARQ